MHRFHSISQDLSKKKNTSSENVLECILSRQRKYYALVYSRNCLLRSLAWRRTERKRFCSKRQNRLYTISAFDVQITTLKEHTSAPKKWLFVQTHRDEILEENLDSDKISAFIHDKNNLKKRLENAEKISHFFRIFWKFMEDRLYFIEKRAKQCVGQHWM